VSRQPNLPLAPGYNNCAFVLKAVVGQQLSGVLGLLGLGARPTVWVEPRPISRGLAGEHVAENPRLSAGLANTKVEASPIRTEAGRGFTGDAEDS